MLPSFQRLFALWLPYLKAIWGNLLRLPTSIEMIKWEGRYGEVLVSPILADDQNLKVFLDTGTHETFFISNQSSIDDKPCRELFFGCYQCRPEVCAAESTEVRFMDGRSANIVHHTGTLELGQKEVTQVKFGLVKSYFGYGLPPHASLGLAPKPEDDDGEFIPLLDQLADKGVIDKREFSIYFNPDNMNEGELIFGGKDITKYQEPSLQVPLTAGEDTWTVDIKGIEVGGKPIQMASTYSILIDSGATSLFAPREVIERILEVIKSSLMAAGKHLDFDWDPSGLHGLENCDDRKYLPSMKLTLQGESDASVIVEVPSALYLLESLEGDECSLLIKEIPRGFAIGVNLLRKYHLHYQPGKRQIGIASTESESKRQAASRKRRIKRLKLSKFGTCLGCKSS